MENLINTVLSSRIPEPELMDDREQVIAYTLMDFTVPHEAFVAEYENRFSKFANGKVIDLGCGSGDVTLRFAKSHPDCAIIAVDGSTPMITEARADVRNEHLKIVWIVDRIPFGKTSFLNGTKFENIVSNSLLHHLPKPEVLWQSVLDLSKSGTNVLIGDLYRPKDTKAAEMLVEEYAAESRDIHKRDFLASLCAAYRVDEIKQQLSNADIDWLSVETVSDRHMLVWGTRP